MDCWMTKTTLLLITIDVQVILNLENTIHREPDR